MTYKQFLSQVKRNTRSIYIPILEQSISRASFIKDGKYDKKKEMKFLKAVYDNRKLREAREQEEFLILQSIQGFKESEE